MVRVMESNVQGGKGRWEGGYEKLMFSWIPSAPSQCFSHIMYKNREEPRNETT